MKQGKARKPFFTESQLGGTIALGIVLGATLILFEEYRFFPASSANLPAQEKREETSVLPLYSKNITECSALCYTPPEEEPVLPRTVAARIAPKPSGITRLSELPKKIKNPNAIRISLAEAPTILAEVKKINGKSTCAKKNDKGHKSKKTNSVHIDRECCLDPDEIPNPRCLYL